MVFACGWIISFNLSEMARWSAGVAAGTSANTQVLCRRPHPFALHPVPDECRKRRFLDGAGIGAAGYAALGEKPLNDPELLGAAGAGFDLRGDGLPGHGIAAPEQRRAQRWRAPRKQLCHLRAAQLLRNR